MLPIYFANACQQAAGLRSIVGWLYLYLLSSTKNLCYIGTGDSQAVTGNTQTILVPTVTIPLVESK
jgi:hypothetical protein